MMGLVEALKWAVPSMLTIGALVCGLTAVRFSAEGDFGSCVKCIFLACLLDGLDGHTARALGTTSAMGFELDSLCDLANFGVCPALVLHFWIQGLAAEPTAPPPSLEWAACCAHAACCALRLARFNVKGHAEQMESQLPDPPGGRAPRPPAPSTVLHNALQRSLYFRGLPAPMGAAYALSPVALALSRLPARLGAAGEPGAWAVGRRGAAATLLATALLMASPLPTLSSKMLWTRRRDSHLRSRGPLAALLKPALGAAALLAAWAAPFELFLAGVALHALSVPLGLALYYGWAKPKGP
jgi:phosphatidylserine synthase